MSSGAIDLGAIDLYGHRRGRPQPTVEMCRRSTNESPGWLARGDSSRIDRVEMSGLAGEIVLRWAVVTLAAVEIGARAAGTGI